MATTPTPITDKNGKQTTVHKKVDGAKTAKTRKLPVAPYQSEGPVKTVSIGISPVALRSLMGERMPSISEGDSYAGMVWSPTKKSVAIYNQLVSDVDAQVADGDNKVVLGLTEDEAAVLFYAVTVGGGSGYESGIVLNNETFSVIAAHAKAGFTFPDRSMVY